VVLPPQVCPPARAGAQLRRLQHIRAVVRLQPGDHPIFNMRDQQAAPAAVMRRAAHAYPLFCGLVSQYRLFVKCLFTVYFERGFP
jgi:hypothetical protein